MSQQIQTNILLGLMTLAIVSFVNGLDVKTILQQTLQVPATNLVATTVVVTFPPGDEGSTPHHHSGPVVGYVLKGSFLFQVEDEPPRILQAGEAFYESDHATHVWFANASDNSTCEILGTIFGRPEEPLLTPVKGVSRVTRAEAIVAAVSAVIAVP